MPRRSSILELPPELREALNARLVAGGFSDYEQLAEWLNAELEAEGLELRVSKSAIHRHGQKFEEKLDALRVATEQAKAVVDAAPDDEGAMSEALVRLVQERLFTVLKDLQVDPKKVNLTGLLKGIAEITKGSVALKRYQAEARARAKVVAENIKTEARKGGLSADVIRQIEEEVLGIVR